ncbi:MULTISPECIES: zinc-binding dehydrogenase [Burkholderia]|uniref:zinc-binding dehydrogenase n=1 Tax=Burkholderia TaxID=32008 RepID=UPI000484B2B5|nr:MULTISPECIES: zinc-binding dehydrogenase [Burkholderia]
MKAICVTAERSLEVRDIRPPSRPEAGHVLIDMEASAINHGDKIFLRMRAEDGRALAPSQHGVWGASGAGTVVATGAGVPARYMGRRVAVYRSLNRSAYNIGLWCEKAQVPCTSCLILPEHVSARDYCGSLVNVITAYAFLETITEAGHRGVIATAGNAATGLALAALARQRNMPAISMVRSQAAQEALQRHGIEHIVRADEDFTDTLGKLSSELGTTAVFDGVGGALTGQMAACLPMRSSVYFYGTMAGPVPFPVSAPLFMMKDLSMQRFSNFESRTVREHERLVAALSALESVIVDPVFRTSLGQEFSLDLIDDAMAYESIDGRKAILTSQS